MHIRRDIVLNHPFFTWIKIGGILVPPEGPRERKTNSTNKPAEMVGLGGLISPGEIFGCIWSVRYDLGVVVINLGLYNG